MRWHVIEGEAGCRYAVEHRCTAIVVDALRASATATMLLHSGATEILAVREVEEAFEAKRAMPDALLFGERGGVPPEGFDFGNSPRDASAAQGRRVIFTTTTGAGRLVSCRGASALMMGCPLNAAAVARIAAHRGDDVVVIPAGLAGDPHFDAQEDWAGAVAIVMEASNPALGEGAAVVAEWQTRIRDEGLEALFARAPHAAKLRHVGMDLDIAYCAQLNTTPCVPLAIEHNEYGVRLGVA